MLQIYLLYKCFLPSYKVVFRMFYHLHLVMRTNECESLPALQPGLYIFYIFIISTLSRKPLNKEKKPKMPPNRIFKKKKNPTRKEIGKPVTGNDVFKLDFFFPFGVCVSTSLWLTHILAFWFVANLLRVDLRLVKSCVPRKYIEEYFQVQCKPLKSQTTCNSKLRGYKIGFFFRLKQKVN